MKLEIEVDVIREVIAGNHINKPYKGRKYLLLEEILLEDDYYNSYIMYDIELKKLEIFGKWYFDGISY